jgi:hypothetical protein
MLTQRHVAFACLLLASLSIPTTLRAAVLPMAAEDMVRQSHTIVVAQVVDQAVHWNKNHNLIVTEYELSVETSVHV